MFLSIYVFLSCLRCVEILQQVAALVAGAGAVLLRAPVGDQRAAAAVEHAARVPHQQHHAQPELGRAGEQLRDLPRAEAHRLDQLDGVEPAGEAEELRHEAEGAEGQHALAVELQMKVHTKVRNHGEGPYTMLNRC